VKLISEDVVLSWELVVGDWLLKICVGLYCRWIRQASKWSG